MNKWEVRVLLGIILLTATALRLTGIAWDDYHHYHPDERYITWVATTIEWPADWRTALDPIQSTMNPYYWPEEAHSVGIEVLQGQPRRFAYGHLPLYLGVVATRLVEWVGPVLRPYFPSHWLITQDILNGAELIEFRHLTVVARALTGLMDVGTVGLVFLLGQRVYGTAVGLLAAAFLALNVMHIQLARFFTADPYLTFFVVAAIYCLVLSVNDAIHSNETQSAPRQRYLLLAAVCVGLAMGSKFSAVLLLLPLAVAAWLGRGQRWERWLVVAGVVAGLTFVLTNPFALLDLTCDVTTPAVNLGPVTVPAINWRSCFLDNVTIQGAMVRRDVDLPFTRQYIGTWPYLYPLEMQLRWGMGPLLGIVAFVGFGWAVWRVAKWGWQAVKRQWTVGDRPLPILNHMELVLLAWTLPFFLITGGFDVKFMRYLQPLTPFLMLYGAAWLGRRPGMTWQKAATVVVLLTTGLYAVGFVNLYDQPHPWVTASQWLYTNAARGSLILGEQWDDSLPTSLVIGGVVRQRNEYRSEELTWLNQVGSRDNETKLAANLALLAEADYVTLASNRVYGVVPRLPGNYPLSSQYYPLLFDGSLGYEPVFVAGRFPQLFGVYLRPDTFRWPNLQPPPLVKTYLSSLPGLSAGRADESFIVYDQPLTIIFQNTGRLTAEQMMRLFTIE